MNKQLSILLIQIQNADEIHQRFVFLCHQKIFIGAAL